MVTDIATTYGLRGLTVHYFKLILVRDRLFIVLVVMIEHFYGDMLPELPRHETMERRNSINAAKGIVNAPKKLIGAQLPWTINGDLGVQHVRAHCPMQQLPGRT